MGQVEEIHIATVASVAMTTVDAIEALTDSGLAGDRYQTGIGFYSPKPRPDGGRQITLIEAETLAALASGHDIKFTGAECRRNLVTRGVRLVDLLGHRFTIGEVVCEGIDHCPPCEHLVQVTGKPVLRPLVGRGGIRARIIEGGTLRIGDAIALLND
jgi:MOSC domain-containing protein YiiM